MKPHSRELRGYFVASIALVVPALALGDICGDLLALGKQSASQFKTLPPGFHLGDSTCGTEMNGSSATYVCTWENSTAETFKSLEASIKACPGVTVEDANIHDAEQRRWWTNFEMKAGKGVTKMDLTGRFQGRHQDPLQLAVYGQAR